MSMSEVRFPLQRHENGSEELYAAVKAGFTLKGSSLQVWCDNHGVHRQAAAAALRGRKNGSQARKLRNSLINAANIVDPGTSGDSATAENPDWALREAARALTDAIDELNVLIESGASERLLDLKIERVLGAIDGLRNEVRNVDEVKRRAAKRALIGGANYG